MLSDEQQALLTQEYHYGQWCHIIQGHYSRKERTFRTFMTMWWAILRSTDLIWCLIFLRSRLFLLHPLLQCSVSFNVIHFLLQAWNGGWQSERRTIWSPSSTPSTRKICCYCWFSKEFFGPWPLSSSSNLAQMTFSGVSAVLFIGSSLQFIQCGIVNTVCYAWRNNVQPAINLFRWVWRWIKYLVAQFSMYYNTRTRDTVNGFQETAMYSADDTSTSSTSDTAGREINITVSLPLPFSNAISPSNLAGHHGWTSQSPTWTRARQNGH